MRRCQRSPPSSVTWSPASSSMRSCMPERVALGRQPPALEGAEHAVGVRLEERRAAVGALPHRPARAPSSSARSVPGRRAARPARIVSARGRPGRHAAPRQLRVAARRGARRRARQRRPERHHHVAQGAQLGGHLLRPPRLEEQRAQPDRRLGRAHLLQHRRAGARPAWGRRRSSAPQPPMLARSRSTASARRSSATVSEMRKKPSPLGPYAPPGDTTTPDSSSTSSQNEAEVVALRHRRPDVDRALRRRHVHADLRAARRTRGRAGARRSRASPPAGRRRAPRRRPAARPRTCPSRCWSSAASRPPPPRRCPRSPRCASRSCSSPWRARTPRRPRPWRPASRGSSGPRSRRRWSRCRRRRARPARRARARTPPPARTGRRARRRRSGCSGS